MAKSVLPQPAPPATSWSAFRQAAASDFVHARDPGRSLGKGFHSIVLLGWCHKDFSS
jgi:hypothetical protein